MKDKDRIWICKVDLPHKIEELKHRHKSPFFVSVDCLWHLDVDCLWYSDVDCLWYSIIFDRATMEDADSRNEYEITYFFFLACSLSFSYVLLLFWLGKFYHDYLTPVSVRVRLTCWSLPDFDKLINKKINIKTKLDFFSTVTMTALKQK